MLHLVPSSSPQDTLQWLQRHRFSPFCRIFSSFSVYHTLYLEDLTLWDLSEKMALLYNITPQQISHIYRQGPTGIHVLVSDEVRMGPRISLMALCKRQLQGTSLIND
ncbi:hypothetical protein J4Q44_G00198210 [Coregonus suidteri]|uniref:GRHL1/CP2 C-terminal domain-containing protein n=1 Tax=Coregonus suidteri TaxID=861788 RepID=A0AAN8LPP4_9TELE